MSRPKPTCIATHKHNRTTTEILEATAMYAVLLDGQPFSVRKFTVPGQGKYPRVTFPSPGHAINMAQKLNKMYGIDGFEVYEMTKGRLVHDGKQGD